MEKVGLVIFITFLFFVSFLILGQYRIDENIEFKYRNISVYCWCFGEFSKAEVFSKSYSKDSIFTVKKVPPSCTTISNIQPESLISNKYLKTKLKDKIKAEEFEAFLKTGKPSNTYYKGVIDARLVLLVENNNEKKDTIVYQNENSLFINNELVEFEDGGLDSVILRTFYELNIECPAN